MSQQLPCCMGYEAGKAPRGLTAWELEAEGSTLAGADCTVTEGAVLSWWQWGAAAGQYRCEAEKDTAVLPLSGQF